MTFLFAFYIFVDAVEADVFFFLITGVFFFLHFIKTFLFSFARMHGPKELFTLNFMLDIVMCNNIFVLHYRLLVI